MDIDINKLEISRRYVLGMNMGDYAQRKYEYEIHNSELKGSVIVHETYTPKINDFEWGKQENLYFIKDNPKKTFKTIIGVLNFLIKTTTKQNDNQP